ncbi:MAG TPA: hypothetical protein VH681_05390 [Nitrospiraceae bacterium]
MHAENATNVAQFGLKKARRLVESPRGREFPQTTVLSRWYGWEEVEVYRRLGNLMAWVYLSRVELPDEELRPSTSCRGL